MPPLGSGLRSGLDPVQSVPVLGGPDPLLRSPDPVPQHLIKSNFVANSSKDVPTHSGSGTPGAARLFLTTSEKQDFDAEHDDGASKVFPQ